MTNHSIVWLRRDIRLHDHAALSAALAGGKPVSCVFVFDAGVLARFPNPNDRRLSFIASALADVDAQLRARGGGLLVLHGEAAEVMPRLANALNAEIFASEDYEPATRARDAKVAESTPLTLLKDQLIFAPSEVLKEDGTPFKVYTPFSKAWWARATPASFAEYAIADAGRYADAPAMRAKAEGAGLRVLEANNPLPAIGYTPQALAEWTTQDARARLRDFVQHKVVGYSTARDMMGQAGTSRISPYVRFGLVSVREAFREARSMLNEVAHQPLSALGELREFKNNGATKWMSELVWREFYAMILYHYPESVAEEWNPAYRGTLAWRRDAAEIEAWKAGLTGYPIVDAAMRELLTTGWMHNRARMIVASFLTKHLQTDWRVGEEHFAQYLMDYDLASNVGGWQWAASTGTDAQPYFRIFNPYLQSKKFDGAGEYIRRFVPELRDAEGDVLHEGWAAGGLLGPTGYPRPIVQHEAGRAAALALFKRDQ